MRNARTLKPSAIIAKKHRAPSKFLQIISKWRTCRVNGEGPAGGLRMLRSVYCGVFLYAKSNTRSFIPDSCSMDMASSSGYGFWYTTSTIPELMSIFAHTTHGCVFT